MSITIGPRKGIIRGRMIELAQPTSLPEGIEVSVSIESEVKEKDGSSLAQAFG